ncbi:MAG TPA: large conductance mechanosensitive channel protein MscL [Blastocatellia bacterium]|jgi:large conductance mechanosensitive channel|nr:large conductance mechanosensitive channel protein MscL [Blastocatellia bacterium]
MLKEFKEFIARGNVIDLAIAVIIGAAFGRIVTSLVNDIVMPPIGLLTGGVDFKNLFVSLRGNYATLEEARKANAPTINYGQFIQYLLEFLIIAFVIFLIIKAINRMKRRPEDLPPTMKACAFCYSSIPTQARRCPHCTSELQAA